MKKMLFYNLVVLMRIHLLSTIDILWQLCKHLLLHWVLFIIVLVLKNVFLVCLILKCNKLSFIINHKLIVNIYRKEKNETNNIFYGSFLFSSSFLLLAVIEASTEWRNSYIFFSLYSTPFNEKKEPWLSYR